MSCHAGLGAGLIARCAIKTAAAAFGWARRLFKEALGLGTLRQRDVSDWASSPALNGQLGRADAAPPSDAHAICCRQPLTGRTTCRKRWTWSRRGRRRFSGLVCAGLKQWQGVNTNYQALGDLLTGSPCRQPGAGMAPTHRRRAAALHGRLSHASGDHHLQCRPIQHRVLALRG